MKKLVLFATVVLVITAVQAKKVTDGPLTITQKAEMLSKDENFNAAFNKIFTISSEISKAKIQESFTKFIAGNSSEAETQKVLQATSMQSAERLKASFSEIAVQFNTFIANYDFLQSKTERKEIIKQALILSAKEYRFESLGKKLTIDCLEVMMVGTTDCAAGYDECTQNGWTDLCVAEFGACCALMFDAVDKCFDVQGQ